MTRIDLDIADVIAISTALVWSAHKAVSVAEEFPHNKSLVKAGVRKFALMNRYRDAVGLDVLTVEELKEKFDE